MDLFNYKRRQSILVNVGATTIGGDSPIRLQSMTTTDTTDTASSVAQAERIIAAGGELVRLTTQGTAHAENLRNINAGLRSKGIMTPLVADVHFNPAVADVAALYAEKVRVNPGNYVDPARTFKELEYTPQEYAAEIQKIRDRFIPFLNICKENHTAIRIGVNHGSLSDRIMSHYGNTPEGMVESCMEFLRICVEQQFKDVVISIKASNTVVMVQTVRLLVKQMEEEKMYFPLHLGVTEAGEGEDGRVKSAIGIGALLADGLGDTIRVSLSEAPEREIPVARELRDYIVSREGSADVFARPAQDFDHFHPSRRPSHAVANIGGQNAPVVIGSLLTAPWEPSVPMGQDDALPDYFYCGGNLPDTDPGCPLILDYPAWVQLTDHTDCYPVFLGFGENWNPDAVEACPAEIKFMFVNYMAMTEQVTDLIRRHPEIVVISQSNHKNRLGEHRAVAHTLWREGITNPVIFFQHYNEQDIDTLRIKAAADSGVLLIDGLADGLAVMNMNPSIPHVLVDRTAFSILQGARVRVTRTEYISCPGCGRTLYNLEETIARIKAATGHLRGLKIAIMGCIVNGPGEMADADYGYVGAGRGKVSLYRQKECIEKNIPEDEAVERLIRLIEEDQNR
ncbi:MAG: 4-hydroxy-3-methylbut-2-en-1-yl diphosphate synthase [Bacteroidaceae bacterium]|nr:4-hydroxy-3-methylbut-2-en-1-yl diphosphate synthase [Bacteroidaceae bacterium]